MMMYDPSALTSDVWAKYTRALTDCNSKTEDYVATRGKGNKIRLTPTLHPSCRPGSNSLL